MRKDNTKRVLVIRSECVNLEEASLAACPMTLPQALSYLGKAP